MANSNPNLTELSIAPLGAGDLIDSATRFYRINFWTFIFIAAPTVIVGSVFAFFWSLLSQMLFNSANPAESSSYHVFLYFGTGVILFVEFIFTFVVMGGASRNFIRHLLYGEPISFIQTYRNVKLRFFSLFFACTLISVILSIFGILTFALTTSIILAIGFGLAYQLQGLPIIAGILIGILSIAIGIVGWWIYFFVALHLLFVPQAILVEGLGVSAAISRSSSLAGRNVWRISLLFIFTTVATWSALMILYIPLELYAWFEGISIFYNTEALPFALDIAQRMIGQISVILITPIWMISLCLLYVDARVRREAYDIELMAVQVLGEMPQLPEDYPNPLRPALSTEARVTKKKSESKKEVRC